MTKVLFILSAVLMLVSIFFARQNGRDFADVRTKVTALNIEVDGVRKSAMAAAGEVTKLDGEIAAVDTDLATEGERVKTQKVRVARADNDARSAQAELDVQNKKLADLRLQLDKLPKGMKPETLVEDIANIRKSIADMQAQVEQKKKEESEEVEKMAGARKELEDVVAKIEERKKAFERNGLSARVVAVNPDWGFVIVNAGQSRGITEASQLLVTRGTQTVGKLAIVSVQGDRTVANILPETLAEGMTIAPGDQVILEKLYLQ